MAVYILNDGVTRHMNFIRDCKNGFSVRPVHRFHDFFMTLVSPSIVLEHESQPPTSNLDLGMYLNNKERIF